MKKLFLGIVVVALMAGVFFGTKMYYAPDTKSVTKSGDGIVSEEKEHSAKIISDGFKNMGELATQEYYFTQVEQFSDKKKLKGISIPFTSSSYTISYDGTIKAGIDFAAIEVEEEGDKIIVTIPKAKILSTELDDNSFKVYDEKSSVFNKIEVSDVNDSIANLKENATKKADEKGLLEKADNNARILIENFVNSLVDESVTKVEYVSAKS